MRRIDRVRLRRALLAAALAAGAARADVEVDFIPVSPADQWDARTYRAIWEEFGRLLFHAEVTAH